jgi:hypothetical protein
MSEPPSGSADPARKALTTLEQTTLEQMAECVHRQALDAAILRDEVSTLHRRLAAGERAAVDVADLRARLAVTEAELDRLRALPELRAGQRFRHTARRGAAGTEGRDGGGRDAAIADLPPPDPQDVDTADLDSTSADAPSEPGLGYPEPRVAAIVVVRNRRGGLESLLTWLGEHGVERIEIVDDATSDPATLEMLAGIGHRVHRLDTSLGPLGPWALGLVAELSLRDPVLVVDADSVPDADCPDDVLAHLVHELRRRPEDDAVDVATERAPDGASSGPPQIRLVRARLPRLPVEIVTVDAPYTARRASWDAAVGDPAERFARRADEADGV